MAGELIRKIKAISRTGAVKSEPSLSVSPISFPTEQFAPRQRVEIVVVGASTGGPNAVADVFANLPRNIPVPILLVLHMPAKFTSIYADRLTRGSRLVIREARDGMVLE